MYGWRDLFELWMIHYAIRMCFVDKADARALRKSGDRPQNFQRGMIGSLPTAWSSRSSTKFERSLRNLQGYSDGLRQGLLT